MDLDRNKIELGDKPALIVVDIINGFTDEKCALGSDSRDVIAANVELLDAFRSKDLPVIFTTAVDGLQNNYPVIVPRQAVGDRNSEAHDSNLYDLHAKYCEVMELQDVLEYIQGL